MDLSKLTKGDKLFAGGAILYIVAMFFNWFSVDTPVGDFGVDGFHYTVTGLFPFLILVALLVVLCIARFTTNGLPTAPWPAIFLGGAALAALLVILRFLIGEDGPVSRSIGLFLAIIGAVVAVVGALAKFKESGGRVEDLKNVDSLKKQFDRPGQV